VKSAPAIGKPAVKAILELGCTSIEEIQDQAYMSVLSFTGMRNHDLHGVKSKNIVFVRCIYANSPLHIDFKLETRKNDRSGQGSKTNLTYSLRKNIFMYVLLFCYY